MLNVECEELRGDATNVLLVLGVEIMQITWHHLDHALGDLISSYSHLINHIAIYFSSPDDVASRFYFTEPYYIVGV